MTYKTNFAADIAFSYPHNRSKHSASTVLCSDISGKQQLSISLRWVDETFAVQEDFTGLYEIDGASADDRRHIFETWTADYSFAWTKVTMARLLCVGM